MLTEEWKCVQDADSLFEYALSFVAACLIGLGNCLLAITVFLLHIQIHFPRNFGTSVASIANSLGNAKKVSDRI